MKRIIPSLIAGLLAGLISLGAVAQTETLTPTKRAAIERLLQVTDAMAMGRQMGATLIEQLTKSLTQQRPDIPRNELAVLPKIVDEVFEENMPHMKEKVIDVYHRHMSEADINAIADFFASEAGKRMVAVQSSMVKQMTEFGFQWGQSLAPEIQRRIREALGRRGYVV